MSGGCDTAASVQWLQELASEAERGDVVSGRDIRDSCHCFAGTLDRSNVRSAVSAHRVERAGSSFDDLVMVVDPSNRKGRATEGHLVDVDAGSGAKSRDDLVGGAHPRPFDVSLGAP